MTLSYLSLGSNLGDRLGNLKSAVAKLREKVAVTSLSSVWETAPINCPAGSSPFLNMVVSCEHEMNERELLAFTQSIEKELGRPNEHEKNAPRTCDIDILTFNDEYVNEPELTIPHPRMKERLFVLAPLRELQKDAFQFGMEYASLLDAQEVRLYAPAFILQQA